MPFKDPEERKAYDKKRYEENKETIAQRQKKYQQKNKEAIAEKRKKKYYEENREERAEKQKKRYEKNKEKIAKYYQTKSAKEIGWKQKGMKFFDDTYERFTECKNCELCNVELSAGKKGKSRKVLDHDHDSGYVRFVCCNACNAKLGVRDRKLDKVHLEFWKHYYINRRY